MREFWDIEVQREIANSWFMCEVFKVAKKSMRGKQGMVCGNLIFRGVIEICLSEDIDDFLFEFLSITIFVLIKWLLLFENMNYCGVD